MPRMLNARMRCFVNVIAFYNDIGLIFNGGLSLVVLGVDLNLVGAGRLNRQR